MVLVNIEFDYLNLINYFFNIIFIDILYFFCLYIFNFNHSKNARWFFIHSISNSFVCYYSFQDLSNVFDNILILPDLSFSINTYISFWYATLIHLYHLIFFKIRKSDLYHHIIMVGICGPLSYYCNSIVTSYALFFLCGLPGLIDYFNLFLYKINLISSLKQKYLYILISTFIRSPGSIVCSFLNIYVIKQNFYYYFNLTKFICYSMTTFLTFMNSQYYLYETYFDYLKKK